jgi:DNA-binding transcriptional regulator GbsR (MarR family)
MTLNIPLTDFIQQATMALQSYFPRAAAEVFALLVVAGEPLSTEEIASTLKQSRAGAGSSIRLLEAQRVLVRSSRPGDRRELFEVTDDAFKTLIDRIAGRLRELADLAREAAAEAPRLQQMTTIFERASESLDPRRHS